MAKGKTNQPLRIVIAQQWKAHPAIEALRQAGHIVITSVFEQDDADLILMPQAHGWCDAMFVTEQKKDGTEYTPYLDAALTAARKRKKEGRK